MKGMYLYETSFTLSVALSFSPSSSLRKKVPKLKSTYNMLDNTQILSERSKGREFIFKTAALQHSLQPI